MFGRRRSKRHAEEPAVRCPGGGRGPGEGIVRWCVAKAILSNYLGVHDKQAE